MKMSCQAWLGHIGGHTHNQQVFLGWVLKVWKHASQRTVSTNEEVRNSFFVGKVCRYRTSLLGPLQQNTTDWGTETAESSFSHNSVRLEVQNQGAREFGFWCEVSSCLADGHLLASSLPVLSSVHTWTEREFSSVYPPFYKDTDLIGLKSRPYDLM